MRWLAPLSVIAITNGRVALQPTVQFLFGADDDSVPYGLVVSLGFGLKR